MTIAIRQTSSIVTFTGSFTASPTLTGVLTGSTLICLVSHGQQDGLYSSFSVNDGNAYTVDTSANSSGYNVSAVTRLSSAASGTHTPAVVFTGGTAGNSYGAAVLLEITGLITSPFDTSASNTGYSTTPATGSTAALAQANEIYFSVLDCQSISGLTYPPTGGPGTYTSIGQGTDGSAPIYDFAYQIQTTGTTAVSAAYGTGGGSNSWAAVIATYKGSAASPVSLAYVSAQGGF